MTQKSYSSDLLLLVASAIWGFAFVAQRVAMDFLGPFTYTAVRFTLGALVLVPFLILRRPDFPKVREKPVSTRRKIGWLQFILGLILFGGISLQQYGLLFTTAGNAGFITGLYVVFVPLTGIFFGHRVGLRLWVSVALASAGLYFLSVGAGFTINPGDIFVFGCALFWTAHVLLVGYLAPRRDPVHIAMIQFTVCSVLSWIVAIGIEEIRLDRIMAAAWPILYGGVLSVGIAYTLQIVAQQKAHPTYASIILSLETVFAVFGGWLILSEEITARIFLGCGLMLTGMILAQIRTINRLT
jgi:drug/metabolite transporter (DMT)-like permease